MLHVRMCIIQHTYIAYNTIISTRGQVDWNIVMINILKQLVRTRTDIKFWPSRYNFPHAVAIIIEHANCHLTAF